ncbi:MAG: 5-methylthioadenosine/S-adenosylhomocysteine deaminase [Dehalococcoidia bacterium]|nr:MAG: 5-methylthioadenosine/S-adenosylhomocysteine deaminase [Dehalococcoidia bacterium]
MQPLTADLVVRGAYLITLDAERRVYRNGHLAVRGDTIVSVGPDSAWNGIARRTIAASGKVLLPGLVNAHNHLNQVVFRGRQDDLPPGAGMAAFAHEQITLWQQAGAETSAAIVRLHLLDLVKGGTTAVHDQHFTNLPRENIEGVLAALDESGMRALVSRCLVSEPALVPPAAIETVDTVLAETARLRQRWNSSRITVTASPINPSWVATAEELVALREGVRALGAPFDIDLAGELWRETLAARGFAGGAVEYCARLGILDDQTLGGKAFALLPYEYQIWADLGVKACMVPFGRLYREGGPALHHFLARGVLPGVGTDAPNSHPTTSLWDAMRLCLVGTATRKQLEQLAGDPFDAAVTPTTETVLEMATLGGARALFLDPRVNGLAVGRAADFILVDTDRPAFAPRFDDCRLVTMLLWCTEAAMVDTVVVAGRVLVEGGRSTVWDEERVIAEAETAAQQLFRAAGLDRTLPPRRPGQRYRRWTYL